MEHSDWISAIAVIIALGSFFLSSKSATAAQTSAQTAKDALESNKKVMEEEQVQRLYTEICNLVTMDEGLKRVLNANKDFLTHNQKRRLATLYLSQKGGYTNITTKMNELEQANLLNDPQRLNQ